MFIDSHHCLLLFVTGALYSPKADFSEVYRFTQYVLVFDSYYFFDSNTFFPGKSYETCQKKLPSTTENKGTADVREVTILLDFNPALQNNAS